MAMSLADFEAGTLAKWEAKRLRVDVKVNLFIQETLKKKALTAGQRVRIAGEFLKDKVKVNLSRPVRKFVRIRKSVHPTTGAKIRQRITTVDPNSRSKPDEFPRADTTRLMKDIFLINDTQNTLDPSAKIGTTLKYGLLLEVAYNRSFLRRTLNEMRAQILLIIQGGSVGGASHG